MTSALDQARSIAATYLESGGHGAQACVVRTGGGDDFIEVKIALLALLAVRGEQQRYRQALANYADAEFWEAELPEATLAFHDRGEIARLAIAGRDLLDPHRD